MLGKVFSVLKCRYNYGFLYRYNKSLSLQAEFAPLYTLLSSGNLLYKTWWDAGASSRNTMRHHTTLLCFKRNIIFGDHVVDCNTTWRLFSWLDKRANTAHHTQPVWCALEKLPTLFAVLVVLGKKSVVKWQLWGQELIPTIVIVPV